MKRRDAIYLFLNTCTIFAGQKICHNGWLGHGELLVLDDAEMEFMGQVIYLLILLKDVICGICAFIQVDTFICILF